MSHKMVISGLMGIMIGAGFGHENKREAMPGFSKATREAEEACHRSALKSAVNSYQLRSLGRSEAYPTGTKIMGVSERNAGMGLGYARQASSDIYRLRSLGRAEAWQIGPDISGNAWRNGNQTAMAARDWNADSYRLRSKGRAEAHGTGTDFCEVERTGVERLGLR
jgi:hypothetical protein